jgi:hypothetical protein
MSCANGEIQRHSNDGDLLHRPENGSVDSCSDPLQLHTPIKENHNLAVNILDTTQLVKVKLIHENWKFIESKKSPIFSTLSRLSRKSHVPPSLSFQQKYRNEVGDLNNNTAEDEMKYVSQTVLNSSRPTRNRYATSEHWAFDDDILRTRKPHRLDATTENGNGRMNGVHGTRLDDSDGLLRDSDRSDTRSFPSSVAAADGIHQTNGVSCGPRETENNRSRKTVDSVDRQLDEVDNRFHLHDTDDEDLDNEILSSVTRRKKRHAQLPGDLDAAIQRSSVENVKSADVSNVDVDALCVTSPADDDNVTLVSRWPNSIKSNERNGFKPATTNVVSTYENLVCLQRDMNRPLYMYIPEPVVHGKPSVGDV